MPPNRSVPVPKLAAMRFAWVVWVLGVAVLAAAGYVTTLLPRRRARAAASQTAWSAARAAIETAGVGRAAAPGPVPEAEEWLPRAELIAARRGGAAAAESAAGDARPFDRLWRA